MMAFDIICRFDVQNSCHVGYWQDVAPDGQHNVKPVVAGVMKRRVQPAQGSHIGKGPVSHMSQIRAFTATQDYIIHLMAKGACDMLDQGAILQQSFRLIAAKAG